MIQTDDEILNLVAKLNTCKEISFDTETTGIDAHQAELVDLFSFSTKFYEAYYIPLSADQTECA
ncbi:MAG: hypothetical protein IPJ39_21930 [Saprospiraceae bacterium]|nr:hypothetical protein [Saprospiraceae bacterium]